MRPEYYADEYKRFATYARQYGDEKLYKVACGADGADYAWTEALMCHAGKNMDGLSLHYYTMPDYYSTEEYPGEKKGPATGFDAGNYYRTLRRALYIDNLIKGHKFIMDRFDPQKKVDIIVDEWGAWHLVEPGTNPSFLFQQNTMRDAMVAAVSLNIFNTHSDRVQMANLAQMINVLQSVVLTEGGAMLLTPTYHVFDLYKGHQDATLIESYVQQDTVGTEDAQVPALHISASKNAEGTVRATIANLCADKPQSVQCLLAGGPFKTAQIRYISGEIDSHNTFDNPSRVEIRNQNDLPVENDAFMLEMPACSVMEVILS